MNGGAGQLHSLFVDFTLKLLQRKVNKGCFCLTKVLLPSTITSWWNHLFSVWHSDSRTQSPRTILTLYSTLTVNILASLIVTLSGMKRNLHFPKAHRRTANVFCFKMTKAGYELNEPMSIFCFRLNAGSKLCIALYFNPFFFHKHIFWSNIIVLWLITINLYLFKSARPPLFGFYICIRAPRYWYCILGSSAIIITTLK